MFSSRSFVDAFLFQTHEFNLGDPERGLSLGEFHIAFNFLGPIPEPMHFYRASRRRGRPG